MQDEAGGRGEDTEELMHCHAGTFALTPVPDRFYSDTSLKLASFPKCIAAADMRISSILSGSPDMIFFHGAVGHKRYILRRPVTGYGGEIRVDNRRCEGVTLTGSQKVHYWLFAPRKVKSVIFNFLTNQ